MCVILKQCNHKMLDDNDCGAIYRISFQLTAECDCFENKTLKRSKRDLTVFHLYRLLSDENHII